MAKEVIVGIDLGTTNSVISYMQADGKVKVIPNPEGTNTTPSVVAFKASGEEIVGNAAKRQAILRELELPEHLTANGLLEALNLLYSRESFLEFAKKLLING